MRQFVKNLSYFLSKPLSLNFIRKLSGENFIFPFYHVVTDNPPAYIKNLYHTIPVSHFLNDLDFLLKNYKPATKQDLLNFIQNSKKSSTPYFFLSFDDGMRECYEVVYPILKQKGLEAAFFINPAFVDNKDLFYRHKINLIIEKIKESNFSSELANILQLNSSSKKELIKKACQLSYSETEKINRACEISGVNIQDYLKNHNPFMTMEQIQELQDNGFIIGSHSYDHPKFWEITEGEMQGQLNKSLNFIDKYIQPTIRSFAFPFSDIEVPESFFRFIFEELELDMSFGTAGIKKDPQQNHIQRIPMDVKLKSAERIIREEYAYFGIKSLFTKNTIIRQ